MLPAAWENIVLRARVLARGATPLYLAAQTGQLECLRALLNAGADKAPEGLRARLQRFAKKREISLKATRAARRAQAPDLKAPQKSGPKAKTRQRSPSNFRRAAMAPEAGKQQAVRYPNKNNAAGAGSGESSKERLQRLSKFQSGFVQSLFQKAFAGIRRGSPSLRRDSKPGPKGQSFRGREKNHIHLACTPRARPLSSRPDN